MPIKNNNLEGVNKTSTDYYDMTEESSKRSSGTQQARQAESDDVNEETTQRPVSSPEGDHWGQNKIATSLDDE